MRTINDPVVKNSKIFRLIYILTILVFFTSCAQKTTDFEPGKSGKNSVTDISFKKDQDKYQINVTTEEKTIFNIYYSKNPYKIIIMIDKAQFASDLMEYNYSNGIVEGVNLIPSANFATIEVNLNQDVSYKIDKSDKSVQVTFYELSSETNTTKSGVKSEEIFVSKHKLGNRIESFSNLSQNSDLLIEIGVNGIVRYDYGYVDEKKFYLDIFDVKSDLARQYFTGKGPVNTVKVGSYYPPKKVRFIFDLNRSMPVFVGQDGNKVVISNNIVEVPKETKFIVSMESIFVNKYQSIIVKLTNNVPFTKSVVNGNLVLTFDESVKVLDTVQNVLSFSEKPFKKVRVRNIDGKTSLIVEPNGEIFAKVDEMPEGILISGSFDKFSKSDINLHEEVAIDESEKDGEDEGIKKVDKKDLVSVSIKDMNVKEAIRLLYYGRAENLVFGKGVEGSVTLYLDNVDYRNALEMIYKENGLVEVKENNITWVITKERYSRMQQEKLEAKLQKAEQKKYEPLYTEIVPVNYTDAASYSGIISSVLSERGKLQLETRTNSFIITDVRSNIEQAKDLLAKLDKPTPQVNIEARIVEVFDTNNLNLGIQWGGKFSESTTAYDFPGTINITGNTDTTGPSGSGYLVNLPVGNPAGALSIALGSISGKYNLDIALSALETRNKAKTISSPRITTLDNQEAEIKSGGTAIIVPTGDNTETEEVDVGIKLKIKPHVTSNNMVFLNIEVEKSTLGQVTANTATTEEKKATTQVLLENGETTVIGGIYEDEHSNTTQGVPFFSDVPFLGWLFKSKQQIYSKRELLVFITPSVVE